MKWRRSPCVDTVKVVNLGRQFPIPLQLFRGRLQLIPMPKGAYNWNGNKYFELKTRGAAAPT